MTKKYIYSKFKYNTQLWFTIVLAMNKIFVVRFTSVKWLWCKMKMEYGRTFKSENCVKASCGSRCVSFTHYYMNLRERENIQQYGIIKGCCWKSKLRVRSINFNHLYISILKIVTYMQLNIQYKVFIFFHGWMNGKSVLFKWDHCSCLIDLFSTLVTILKEKTNRDFLVFAFPFRFICECWTR